jgi:hypothetical protein
MQPTRYTIANSQSLTDQFRSILREAEIDGRREEVVTSMRRIFHQLSLVPLDVGEERETYEHLGLPMRITFHGPLIVRYGVHEESHTVFIESVRYSPRR